MFVPAPIRVILRVIHFHRCRALRLGCWRNHWSGCIAVAGIRVGLVKLHRVLVLHGAACHRVLCRAIKITSGAVHAGVESDTKQLSGRVSRLADGGGAG